MRWSDIPFDPPVKTLRQFGGLGLLILGLLAIWFGLIPGNHVLFAFLALAGTSLGLLGWLKPEWLRPVFVGWMVVAFPIGWTVSNVILICIYYAIFTPVAVIFQCMGRDPLDRRAKPKRESYWQPKPMPEETSRYFRQF